MWMLFGSEQKSYINPPHDLLLDSHDDDGYVDFEHDVDCDGDWSGGERIKGIKTLELITHLIEFNDNCYSVVE